MTSIRMTPFTSRAFFSTARGRKSFDRKKICRRQLKQGQNEDSGEKNEYKKSELRNNNVNRENSHFLLKKITFNTVKRGLHSVEAYVCYTDFVVSKQS